MAKHRPTPPASPVPSTIVPSAPTSAATGLPAPGKPGKPGKGHKQRDLPKVAPFAGLPSAGAPAIESPVISQREAPATPPSAPSRQLQVFPNPQSERDYTIQFQIPEFTCNCPLTGQPDFAHFTIDMVCDKLCVELKSLKLYMWSYRNDGAFHEKVTNDILDDIVQATQPRFVRVTARWYVRGGIYTNVVVEHRQKGWSPQPVVQLPEHARETGMLG